MAATQQILSNSAVYFDSNLLVCLIRIDSHKKANHSQAVKVNLLTLLKMLIK